MNNFMGQFDRAKKDTQIAGRTQFIGVSVKVFLELAVEAAD